MIRPLGVPMSSLIDRPPGAARATGALTHLRAEPERSEGADPLGARYFHPARRARRWWPWALALLVLVALAFLSTVASAQDACSVNICKPDYDPLATGEPDGTMTFLGAILLGAFIVWAVVTESIGLLWWNW